MNSTVMDLVDAHDIFCPGETNMQTVKDFISTLESFQCIENCDSKQLQQFSSKISNCLNSQLHEDKLNALCALEILVQQCSADFFNQNIGSFINSILHQVLKCQQVQPQLCNKACHILANIINFAPSFPDVSRQLSSLATSLITCMIEISNNSRCLSSAMYCLSALMSTYPGPCATNAKNIEALLVRNMSQKCHASAKQVWFFHQYIYISNSKGVIFVHNN